MKLITNKKLLVTALEYTTLANYKINKDEEDSVLLSCDGYCLTISGGNEENNIEFIIEAETEEPGDIIINAGSLAQQLKNFPGNDICITGNTEFVYFETSDDVKEFEKCNTKVLAVESTKFNSYDVLKEEIVGKIISGELSDAINSVLTAIDKKAAVEKLQNIAIKIKKEQIEFIGFSGKRLIRNYLPFTSPNNLEEKIFTVSLTAAKNLVKLLKKGKKEVAIKLEKNDNGNFVTFHSETCIVKWKVLGLGYPNYAQVISDKFDYEIKLNSKMLKSVISRIPGIGSEKANIILELVPDNNNLKINTCIDGVNSNHVIPAEFTGDIQTIKILGKDIKEGFSNIKEDNFKICLSNKFLITIKEEISENYLFIASICK